MGGGVSLDTDPYYANVISLAHFDGADGNTGPFSDQVEARAPGWTRVAVGPEIDTAQSVFGGASLLCNDVGVSNPDHTDWNFGSGDFTIEMRIRIPNDTDTQTIIGKVGSANAYSPFFLYVTGGNLVYLGSTSGTAWEITGLQTSMLGSVDTWRAVAITRATDAYTLYFDGVRQGVTAVSGAVLVTDGDVIVGAHRNADPALGFPGWIDELRVTKGVARYTGESYVVAPTAFPNA
jgi:hypothetical protein